MKKNTLRLIFGIIISILFIYLSVKNVSLKKLPLYFKEINNSFFYLFFLITCILTLFAMFFRGIRWKYLITFSETNYFYLFLIENFGYFINYILPGKIGEFAKSFVVSDDYKIPFSSVFATVLVERILDLIFILSLGVLIPEEVAQVSSVFLKIKFFSIILIIITLIAVITLILSKPKLKNLKDRKFFSFLYMFTEGLNIFKRPLNLLIAVLSTFLVWFFTALSIYVLYKGMQINLPFFNAIITLYLFTLGITIPSSPGDIGPFHFFIKISLTTFGIGHEKALSFAIIYHLTQFLSVIPIGLFITIKKGFKWR